MSAKELVAAAEKIISDWRTMKEMLNAPLFPQCPSELLARHILATVRAGMDWWPNVFSGKVSGTLRIPATEIRRTTPLRSTRGQFRQLLGVALTETENPA